MDENNYLIIVKGENKTKEICFCNYNKQTNKVDIKYNNGRKYSYNPPNVKKLIFHKELDHQNYIISTNDKILCNIKKLYIYKDKKNTIYSIYFNNKQKELYENSQIIITKKELIKDNLTIFNYINDIAQINELKNKKNNKSLLSKHFENINSIDKNVVLYKYLNPHLFKEEKPTNDTIIFPFGCNNSQYNAVSKAMSNQISVIEGPPGTGKTQTILNIIANILLKNKTVLIVSNNNSAINNIYQKLASDKYNLEFIVAQLGNYENKEKFINNQEKNYPDFSSWKTTDKNIIKKVTLECKKIKKVFQENEKLSKINKEYDELKVELQYFNKHAKKTLINYNIKHIKPFLSKECLYLWRYCQMAIDNNKKLGLIFKLKCLIKLGIFNADFFKLDSTKQITIFQLMYYKKRKIELEKDRKKIIKRLKNKEALINNLQNNSICILKNHIAENYEDKQKRQHFTKKDFYEHPKEFLKEYPINLSTTFSSNNNLNPNIKYDYLIMDEASQVDIATGALALSCAKKL